MKKMIFISIVLLTIACSVACGEGLLPQLPDVYGVAMPSLCEVLGRYPDSIEVLDNGIKKEIFTSVTEEQYIAFGDNLSKAGCEISDSSVKELIFSATISKEGKCFLFTYDTSNLIVTLEYQPGAYDPIVEDAEKQYQSAISQMGNNQFEAALDIFGEIIGYKDVESKIVEATEGKIEADYQRAVSLLAAGKYKEAYDIFSQILEYKDVHYLLDHNEGLFMVGLHRRWPIGGKLKLGVYNDANKNPYTGEIEAGTEIEWEILEYDGNKALICTVKHIGKRSYNNNDEAATNWSTCWLRKWLNGTFYKNTFSAKEQKIIIETKLSNPSSLRVSGGPDTKDKIFISDKRINGHEGWAWIRVPEDYKSNCVMCENGHYGNAKNKNPVYPMMWINLVEYDAWTYTKVD